MAILPDGTITAMDTIRKYPRTRHVEGSGLQKGDHDLETVPFADVAGKHLVIEEKLDGANVGISFDAYTGDLLLQCRGHYLTGGGATEAQFNLLKPWARTHQMWLQSTLGTRYILYGEWLYAKHTVFYDALPHYLMEFDILDTATGDFLSTDRRHDMLAGGPVVSVPVVHTAAVTTPKALNALVRPSLYKTPQWRERLRAAAEKVGSDPEQVEKRETDGSDNSEGLYIKWEEDGVVRGRYKWVRRDFLNAILDSGTHWRERPIVANRLRDGVDLFDAAKLAASQGS
jgi:hypothetical protein